MNGYTHSAKHTSVDLTEGPILPELISFALPLMLGQVFQNLYNSVDSIIAGNFVGVTALAAITTCADIARLLTGFFTGLAAGAGVVFARYFGAKKENDLHRSIHTALTFAIQLGLFMMTVGIVFSPALLRLVRCTEDVFGEALVYLRLYLVGILFTSLYNVGAAVLRSVGDSRTPFNVLVASSLLNVVLDFLFIVAIPMGVAGAALATILSQALSVAIVAVKMLRTTDVYRLVPKDLTIDAAYLRDIVLLGIPSAIQTGLIAFSNLFVQRYVNGFGTAAMAGTGIGKKIDAYVGLVAVSFGQAMTTFAGQCMGAGKKERARKGLRLSLLLNFGLLIVIGIPVYFFAEPVARLFTPDAGAIAFGITMVRILIPLYGFQVLMQILSNTLRGFGHSLYAMVTTTTGLIVCRQIYLAIAMRISHDIRLVYLGWPVGWFFAFLFSFICYLFLVVKKDG